MNSLRILKLKQLDNARLSWGWSDGHDGLVTLQTLRDRCPCAECNGETVLLRTHEPPEPVKETPGRYVLKGAETVGEYALKFVWGDGHDMGLYTWEHLRRMCECEACSVQRARQSGS